MSQVQVFTSKVKERVEQKQQPEGVSPDKQKPDDPLSKMASVAAEKLRPLVQQQYRDRTIIDRVQEIAEPKVNAPQPTPSKLGGAKDYGTDKTEKHGHSESMARESRTDAPRTEKKLERTPDTIILPTLQTHTANALREVVKHEINEQFNNGGGNTGTRKTKEEEEEIEKILAGVPYLQKKDIVEKAVKKVEGIAKEAHISKIDLNAILKFLENIKEELIDKKNPDTQKRVNDFMKQFSND